MGATKKSQATSMATSATKVNKNCAKLSPKKVKSEEKKKSRLTALTSQSSLNEPGTSSDKVLKNLPAKKSSLAAKLVGVSKTLKEHLTKNMTLAKSSKRVPADSKIESQGTRNTAKKPAQGKKVEKNKAINKMLKNLDIKITGFPNFLTEEKIVDCSISENVKTKYRAAKISPGPFFQKFIGETKIEEPAPAKERKTSTSKEETQQDLKLAPNKRDQFDKINKNKDLTPKRSKNITEKVCSKNLVSDLVKITSKKVQKIIAANAIDDGPSSDKCDLIYDTGVIPELDICKKLNNKKSENNQKTKKIEISDESDKKTETTLADSNLEISKNTKKGTKEDLKQNVLCKISTEVKNSISNDQEVELQLEDDNNFSKKSTSKITTMCSKRNAPNAADIDNSIVKNKSKISVLPQTNVSSSENSGKKNSNKSSSSANLFKVTESEISKFDEKNTTNKGSKDAEVKEKSKKEEIKNSSAKIDKGSLIMLDEKHLFIAGENKNNITSKMKTVSVENSPKRSEKQKDKNTNKIESCLSTRENERQEIRSKKVENTIGNDPGQNTIQENVDVKAHDKQDIGEDNRTNMTSALNKNEPISSVSSGGIQKDDFEKFSVQSKTTKLGLTSKIPKFQAAKELLQKKYVSAFKVKGKSAEIKSTPVVQKKLTEKKNENTSAKETNKSSQLDIYDFKSESETEENIKMNLLEALTKKKTDIFKISSEKESCTPTQSNLEKPKTEDSQLSEVKTLNLLVSEKDPLAIDEETTPAMKLETKKSANIKKGRPPKKVVPPKKKILKSKISASESDSENEPSLKKRKKVVFVQKRHRMASLNALAKVQCLYENESRTAHELGLSKTMQIPKIRTIQSGESSEDEKNEKKALSRAIRESLLMVKESKPEIKQVVEESEDEEEEEEEVETKRELRNVPGLRGMGKHWDFNDCSSFESANESDVSYKGEIDARKLKTKKRKLQKAKLIKARLKIKKKLLKIKKPKKKKVNSDNESDDKKMKNVEKPKKKKLVYKKRKHKDEYLQTLKGLARKRIAGLNASAIVAATYELEGHLDRNLNLEMSSSDSLDEKKKKDKPSSPVVKKTKETKKETTGSSVTSDDGKDTKETKDTSSRPTSSSVVIVQDTDVTITGVYVNSSTGSSQESYCKMQYRVQSSVTEERVLRPNSIEPPPKSYTPLGALSNMLPPNSSGNSEVQLNNQLTSAQPVPASINASQSQQHQHQHTQQHQHQQQQSHPPQQQISHMQSNVYGPQNHPHHPIQQSVHHHHHHPQQHSVESTSHLYPPTQLPNPHMNHYASAIPTYDNVQYQYQHSDNGHLQHHMHHFPQQSGMQPQSGRCESPSSIQYHMPPPSQSSYLPQGPIMASSVSGSSLGGSQSAFCAPNIQQHQQHQQTHQSHHDLSGYYQPAGPLISPHVISAQPQSQTQSSNAGLLVPSSNSKQAQINSDIDSQQQPLQQPPQSTSAAESTDSDVLITGGDLSTFRYPSSIIAAQQQQQQQQQPNTNNSGSTAGQLSVLASAAQLQAANTYSRSMHQMHYPPSYPHSYYNPYPSEMCYTPSYQPYFPTTKVYPGAQYHRRYPATTAYFPPGPPPQPNPSDLYDPSVTPSVVGGGQSPQHQSQTQSTTSTNSQLVPLGTVPPSQLQQTGPLPPQHMDHYPGPPGFYSGYNPGGPPGSGGGGGAAQCYSRGIQPPYIEYPPPCPCPMQSCPKNVLTGPLIGSSSSSNGNSSVNNSKNNNIQNSNTMSNNNLSTMMNSDIKTMNSNNSSMIMNSTINSISNSTTTATSQNSSNTTSNSLNYNVSHLHNNSSITSSQPQPLNANNVGPVQKNSSNHLNGHHHHHHHHICKREILDHASPPPSSTITSQSKLKSEPKTEINENQNSDPVTKSFSNNIIIDPPTPPPSANGGVIIGGYTVNEKLLEPDMTISPARGSTGLPTEPDQADKAATITSAAANMTTITPTDLNSTQVQGSSVRKPRLGKAMVREYIYNSASLATTSTTASTAQPLLIHAQQAQIFSHQSQNTFPSHLQSSVRDQSEAINYHTNSNNSDNNTISINPKNHKHQTESKSIIKREEIKSEDDEDVVLILDDEQKIKIEEPEIVEVFDDDQHQQKQNETPPKRMKILESKSTKKSPQNGYKSLIKQTESKPYLCLSRKPMKKDRFGKFIKQASREGSGIRKRKLILTEEQKSRLKERRRKLKEMAKEKEKLDREKYEREKDREKHEKEKFEKIKLEKEKREKELLEREKLEKQKDDKSNSENFEKDKIDADTNEEQMSAEQPEKENEAVNEKITDNYSQKDDNAESDSVVSEADKRNETLKTPLDITIDLVSRGYFSEPEIRSSIMPSPMPAKKTSKFYTKNKKSVCKKEVRSKSETKKTKPKEKLKKTEIEKSTLEAEFLTQALSDFEIITINQNGKSKTHKKPESKKGKKSTKNKISTNLLEDETRNQTENDKLVTTNNNNFLDYSTQTSIEKSVKKTAKNILPNVPKNDENNETDAVNSTNVDEEVIAPPSPPLMANPQLLLPTKEYFEEIFGRARHNQPQRRKTSKGRQRFSRTKKRRIQALDATEIEIVPRKANVIPKWNNGWHWEGEPFQGKIFLNSDDPLVFRTCYPAMRHSEGDIIRPRDCVLLRAGGGAKNKELPYVAKVAHLWENPEDGEMMMSLLWYYRPEHTEQGRQLNDCSDEVFASRHRDHNSVACIEDKCYVLTYSEYCRYRRSIRALEQGIMEEPQIVPPLQNYYNPREVPRNTNPEQVMFCQRVYEFRLKRLMKIN